MSDKGVSTPLYRESGYAVNWEIYLNKCIKKKIIPSIEKHHSDDEYIFWPDLAISHYAKAVVDYMDNKNVNFVKIENNPVNLLEIVIN